MKLFVLFAIIFALIAYVAYYASRLSVDFEGPFTVRIEDTSVTYQRSKDGMLIIKAKTLNDYPYAIGYAHAMDRFAQMDFTRILGQGRLAETLVANEQTVKVDKFIRSMGFQADAEASMKDMDEEALTWLNAYTAGVNAFLKSMTFKPMELILTGRPVELWTNEDSLVTLKIMSYIGLASTQQDFEKITLQAIRGGVDPETLASVFPLMNDYTPEIVEYLKKVELGFPIVPKEAEFLQKGIPSMHASNNFAVGQGSSFTNQALLALDPHLEINRIPAVWVEILFKYEEGDVAGITMPGLFPVIMGRNKHVSWSFTYGFADQIDYFIEEVKDGKYKRTNDQGEDVWFDFDIRMEHIRLASPLEKKDVLDHTQNETEKVDQFPFLSLKQSTEF